MLSKNWFSEMNAECWPGQVFSLEVEQLLHQEKTKYQDIVLFQRLGSRDLTLILSYSCLKFFKLNFRYILIFLKLKGIESH